MKIAAVYIRVSTEEQTEYSPEAQLVELQNYAQSHQYHIPEEYIFIDQGISGKNTQKREQFQKMIATAKTTPKPFEVILLWKYSRFARNREDSVVYKSMLRKQLGINVLSISEPVGEDKMSLILEAMIEAMDEYYSINLAEEVKRGMSEKARRGELQTTASYGYKIAENQLIPLDHEAQLVVEMYQRYLQGQGFFAIATWLNSLGAKTHRGRAFEHRSVAYILQNPVYMGKLRWNPQGKTGRNFQQDGIIIAPATHQALVEEELWEKVQHRILQQKKHRKLSEKPCEHKKDWLSGLLRCGHCSGAMVFSKPHYFKCNNYLRGACPQSQHIHRDLLHQAIWEQLEKDCQSTAVMNYQILPQSPSNELSLLEQALTQLQGKQSRLQEAFLSGVDSLEEYHSKKIALQQQQEQLQGQLKNAQSLEDTPKLSSQDIEHCLKLNIRELFARGTISQNHRLFQELVDHCSFDKSTMTLTMVYREHHQEHHQEHHREHHSKRP